MALDRLYGRKSSTKSVNEDEDCASLRTRERLCEVQGQIGRWKYSSRETSSRTREQLARVEKELARLRLGETSSATRDELAEIEAEIAREEDSSTIVSKSFGQPRPSSRDKVRESTEKLHFIRSRKAEITQLFEVLKRSQTVDLCFLIDCTGSMNPYINEVKNKVQDLVANCKATFSDLDLKVAFIGYRDHCDGSDRIVSLNFTTKISAFKTFMETIKASGGGDAAEDVFGGLEKVGELAWSAPTRILFHVADAPCHGRRFHDGVSDNYPNGDPRGLRAEDLLKRFEELHMKYWFAKLSDVTDKMVQVFQSLVKHPQMVKQVKLDSVEELIPAVADSVSSSIREMESATIADAAAVKTYSAEYDTVVHRRDSGEAQAKRRSLKEFKLCKNISNWNEVDDEAAYVFRNKLPTIMGELQTSLKEECRKRRIKIAAQPFSEGTQRIVYYGVDCTFSPSKKVVFKEFKYLGEGLNKLESYKKQMEIQSISSFLAQQFNKQKPPGAKDIHFIKVVVISLYERSKPFYCSQEPLIEGSYVKYNSNCGFVNKDAYAASLNAFSHWTYQVTNGYLMVVDLQGIQVNSPAGPKFTLTDPALHCKDLTRFCSTNLGKQGMHRFFRTDHCNSICKAMKLEQHRHQPAPTSLTLEAAGTAVRS